MASGRVSVEDAIETARFRVAAGQLMRSYFGTIGAKGGKKGGKRRSPAKKAAARENGKLGGRGRTRDKRLALQFAAELEKRKQGGGINGEPDMQEPAL